MSEKTGIAWCDHSFNCWWGCTKVSPGCRGCYAETFSNRYGFDVWGPHADRRFFGDKHWAEPLAWNRKAQDAGVRRRVFCASMADVFEEHANARVNQALVDARRRLWGLIEITSSLDWLLLTKRPENMIRMLPHEWIENPRPNVWLGTSTEDQWHADQRIPFLLRTPAAVRFISAEPLIGPIQFGVMQGTTCSFFDYGVGTNDEGEPKLHWLIIGGESGHNARPFDVQWARDILAQCKGAGIPAFMKQVGARPGFHLDDEERQGNLMPGFDDVDVASRLNIKKLRDAKGGDPSEWPREIRIQEFPK